VIGWQESKECAALCNCCHYVHLCHRSLCHVKLNGFHAYVLLLCLAFSALQRATNMGLLVNGKGSCIAQSSSRVSYEHMHTCPVPNSMPLWQWTASLAQGVSIFRYAARISDGGSWRKVNEAWVGKAPVNGSLMSFIAAWLMHVQRGKTCIGNERWTRRLYTVMPLRRRFSICLTLVLYSGAGRHMYSRCESPNYSQVMKDQSRIRRQGATIKNDSVL
jgi:hypothetical protein